MPFVRTQVEKVSSITLKYLTLRAQALERLIASLLSDFCAGLKICLICVHILILTYNLDQISRILNELCIDLVTEDGPLRHKVDHN